MKTITNLVTMIVIGALAVVGFAYSGFYDVSASSPHSGLIEWLLSTTTHASVERRAKDIDVPDLDRDSLLRAGINDFDAMCVGCHGAPGIQPGGLAPGLNPPAPDLAESAGHMTPAALFWVTKHGIKMTGMPAWGTTHEDEELWPVVAFVATLPTLDADAYQALLLSAEGVGHHGADDASHDEASSHEHRDAGDDQAVRVDDHSTHRHDEEPSVEPEVEQEEHDHGDHAH